MLVNNINKQEKFIEKSIRTHGDKYDYSKVKYVNTRINVIILYKKHNFEFNQKPDNHIKGQIIQNVVYKKEAIKQKIIYLE